MDSVAGTIDGMNTIVARFDNQNYASDVIVATVGALNKPGRVPRPPWKLASKLTADSASERGLKAERFHSAVLGVDADQNAGRVQQQVVSEARLNSPQACCVANRKKVQRLDLKIPQDVQVILVSSVHMPTHFGGLVSEITCA